jgi:hypothetical protein
MTKDQVINAIMVAIPSERNRANEIAEGHLQKAILKLGRSREVDFNQDIQTFTTVSGTAEYVVGKDIFADISNIWDISALYNTDTPNWKVNVLGVDDFSAYARGTTTTGRPQIATLHSSSVTLELWPEPDDAYNMKANVRRVIENFDAIPPAYHDVLIDYAVASIVAAMATENPNASAMMARDGAAAVSVDTKTSWSGSTILLARHLGGSTGRVRCDSGNLRPS